MKLDELAAQHGTDKGSSSHWYTRHYETILGGIRLNVESVCEVGVGSGASLLMWRDWFPGAMIYGVDQNHQNDFGDRIVCYEIEQTDCEKLGNYLGDKNLEIIIDDASHEPDKTMTTLDCMWPMLQPKGWYVIEDMSKDSFPGDIGKWCGLHHGEVRQLSIIDNKSHGCVITFIHKR